MDTENNEAANAARNFAIGLRGLARASSVYPNITHQVVELAKELPIPSQCLDSKQCKFFFVLVDINLVKKYVAMFSFRNGILCNLTWRIAWLKHNGGRCIITSWNCTYLSSMVAGAPSPGELLDRLAMVAGTSLPGELQTILFHMMNSVALYTNPPFLIPIILFIQVHSFPKQHQILIQILLMLIIMHRPVVIISNCRRFQMYFAMK